MTTHKSPCALILFWIFVFKNIDSADAAKCQTTRTVQTTWKAACAEFTQMMVTGYTLDKKGSGLADMSDTEVSQFMQAAMAKNSSTPRCVYSREREETISSCCDGWTGAACDLPVCNPPCNVHNARGCVAPNVCDCKDGYTAYRCDDLTKQQESTLQYCYKASTCYGEKHKGFGDVTVSQDKCCGDGGGSWGVGGTDHCVTCPETGQLAPAVIMQTTNLPFRTCLNFGRSFYRMFDGLEFQFAGTCTYTLAESVLQGWHVEVTLKNCDYWTTCRKLVKTYTDSGDTVETEGGQVKVNGHPVSILPDKPLLTPEKSFTVSVIGDWVLLESASGLRVKADHASTVYVTLDKSKTAEHQVRGLCGNNNGVPGIPDEFAGTTNPTTFGNAFKVVNTGGVCPDSTAVQKYCPEATSRERREAEEACSYIRSSVFSGCHSLIDVNIWYRMCMNYHCAADTPEDKTAVRCFYTEAYARECSGQGVVVHWRTVAACPKECPPGLVYSDCASPCPATCQSLHQPVTCPADCVTGCQCPPGRVLQDGRCVEPAACQCEYNHIRFNNTAVIQIGCNKCKCYMGKWQCTDDKCSSSCNYYGMSHVKTFDGLEYEFEAAPCTYDLVQPASEAIKADPRANLVIRALHEDCGTYMAGRNCIAGVRVETQGESVVIQGGSVQVNGQDYTAYIQDKPYLSHHLYVKQVTSLFKLVRGFGFRVLYGQRRIYVSVESFYDNKIQGLCGKFNYVTNDDWMAPNGITENKAGAFVSHYMTPPNCARQAERPSFPDCPILKLQYAKEICEPVRDATSLWKRCRDLLDFNVYYQQCLSDVCSVNSLDVSAPACVILSVVARECALLGAEIDDWSGHASIRGKCDDLNRCGSSGGSVYSECSSSCQGHCRDKEVADTSCKEECVAGCTCPPGQIMDDNGDCVRLGQCTCYDKYAPDGDRIRKAGDVIERNCQRCTCVNGAWQCALVKHCLTGVTCPRNQRYLEDSHVCQSTCETHGYDCGPGYVYTGCGCPENTTMAPDGQCVSTGECPCQYGTEWFPVGKIVKSGCKELRCQGQKWVVEKDNNCPGSCWAAGDPHYKTFDGRHYSFQGVCSYTLVRDATSGGAFDVTVQNMPCGTTGVTCTKAVTVRMYGVTVRLLRGMPPTVDNITVTGSAYKTHGLTISRSGLWVFVRAPKLKVTVQYDEGTRVGVYLDGSWRNNVEGLCGNFDGRQNNDGGLNVVDFANDWKTSTACADAPTPRPEELDPCHGVEHREPWATQMCSLIVTGDAFSACREKMEDWMEKFYYQDCVFDACRCDMGGDCDCLCTSLANFAEKCNELGTPVRWRSQKLCPLQCDYGKVYTPCGSPYLQTCDTLGWGPDDTPTDSSPCVEGCFCPQGFVELGEKCVPADDCPCTQSGQTYPQGTAVKHNCMNCTCKRGKFECTGTNCTGACAPGEFLCTNGDCIGQQYVCDGYSDCHDGSDENNCTAKQCDKDEFRCGNGRCINVKFKCDGFYDCLDMSDEAECGVPSCGADEFTCRSGYCIPLSFKCDGESDCGPMDGSDERNCPVIKECAVVRTFRCGNGACVPYTLRCDRHDDCGDGSDEIGCNCTCDGQGLFACGSCECLDKYRQCDGVRDCADGSDERNCSCKAGEFTCDDGKCVQSTQHCDGDVDCQDGSDEEGCGVTTHRPSGTPITPPSCVYIEAMATPGAIQSQDISVDDPEVEASKENIRPGREPLKSYKNTLAITVTLPFGTPVESIWLPLSENVAGFTVHVKRTGQLFPVQDGKIFGPTDTVSLRGQSVDGVVVTMTSPVRPARPYYVELEISACIDVRIESTTPVVVTKPTPTECTERMLDGDSRYVRVEGSTSKPGNEPEDALLPESGPVSCWQPVDSDPLPRLTLNILSAGDALVTKLQMTVRGVTIVMVEYLPSSFMPPVRVLSDATVPSDIEFSSPSGKSARVIQIKLVPAAGTPIKLCGLIVTACFEPLVKTTAPTVSSIESSTYTSTYTMTPSSSSLSSVTSSQESTSSTASSEFSTSSPYSSESSTATPYSSKTSSATPYSSESSTATPYSSKTSSATPYSSESSTATPYSSKTSSATPYSSESSTATPYSSKTSSATPYSSKTSSATPYSSESSTSTPYSSKTSSATPYSSESSTATPYSSKTSTATPYSSKASSATPYSSESSTSTPYSSKTSSATPYPSESSTSTQSSEYSSSTPSSEYSSSTPSSQSSSSTPSSESSSSTSSSESSTSTPSSESATSTPSSESSTSTPSSQYSSSTPSSESSSSTQSSEYSSSTPSSESSTSTPSSEYSSSTPSSQSSTSTPYSSESSISTTSSEYSTSTPTSSEYPSSTTSSKYSTSTTYSESSSSTTYSEYSSSTPPSEYSSSTASSESSTATAYSESSSTPPSESSYSTTSSESSLPSTTSSESSLPSTTSSESSLPSTTTSKSLLPSTTSSESSLPSTTSSESSLPSTTSSELSLPSTTSSASSLPSTTASESSLPSSTASESSTYTLSSEASTSSSPYSLVTTTPEVCLEPLTTSRAQYEYSSQGPLSGNGTFDGEPWRPLFSDATPALTVKFRAAMQVRQVTLRGSTLTALLEYQTPAGAWETEYDKDGRPRVFRLDKPDVTTKFRFAPVKVTALRVRITSGGGAYLQVELYGCQVGVIETTTPSVTTMSESVLTTVSSLQESSSTTVSMVTPCFVSEGMSSPLSIPSNVIFTDDEAAMKNIDNIRPGSVSPLLIRKNDPVIRIVLPVVFVESVALVTSTNVDSFRVKVKRPINSTLKPVSGGKKFLPSERVPINHAVIEVDIELFGTAPYQLRISVIACYPTGSSTLSVVSETTPSSSLPTTPFVSSSESETTPGVTSSATSPGESSSATTSGVTSSKTTPVVSSSESTPGMSSSQSATTPGESSSATTPGESSSSATTPGVTSSATTPGVTSSSATTPGVSSSESTPVMSSSQSATTPGESSSATTPVETPSSATTPGVTSSATTPGVTSSESTTAYGSSYPESTLGVSSSETGPTTPSVSSSESTATALVSSSISTTTPLVTSSVSATTPLVTSSESATTLLVTSSESATTPFVTSSKSTTTHGESTSATTPGVSSSETGSTTPSTGSTPGSSVSSSGVTMSSEPGYISTPGTSSTPGTASSVSSSIGTSTPSVTESSSTTRSVSSLSETTSSLSTPGTRSTPGYSSSVSSSTGTVTPSVAESSSTMSSVSSATETTSAESYSTGTETPSIAESSSTTSSTSSATEITSAESYSTGTTTPSVTESSSTTSSTSSSTETTSAESYSTGTTSSATESSPTTSSTSSSTETTSAESYSTGKTSSVTESSPTTSSTYSSTETTSAESYSTGTTSSVTESSPTTSSTSSSIETTSAESYSTGTATPSIAESSSTMFSVSSATETTSAESYSTGTTTSSVAESSYTTSSTSSATETTSTEPYSTGTTTPPIAEPSSTTPGVSSSTGTTRSVSTPGTSSIPGTSSSVLSSTGTVESRSTTPSISLSSETTSYISTTGTISTPGYSSSVSSSTGTATSVAESSSTTAGVSSYTETTSSVASTTGTMTPSIAESLSTTSSVSSATETTTSVVSSTGTTTPSIAESSTTFSVPSSSETISYPSTPGTSSTPGYSSSVSQSIGTATPTVAESSSTTSSVSSFTETSSASTPGTVSSLGSSTSSVSLSTVSETPSITESSSTTPGVSSAIESTRSVSTPESMSSPVSTTSTMSSETESTIYVSSSVSSSSSSTPSVYSSMTPTGSITTPSTSEAPSSSSIEVTAGLTTRCEVIEGMSKPLFIGRDSIVDVKNESLDDVDMLRPNSLRPFSVDKDAFTVKIWFMPAIPIESVKLPTAENVKSITVEFVRPDKNATTVLAAQDVSPSTIVQFLGLPDAVDILITFSRDQSNKTMKFRLEVYGCFRYMTTTAVPTVSVFTTVSSSSVLTTESSLASSSLTTEPSLTASQGITLGYVSSETTTASYSSEKTTPPSYTTVQTTLPPIVTSHTAYTTSYVTVYTTEPCLLLKGMESYHDIPNGNIRTNDITVDANRLRPQIGNPLKSHRPNLKVTVDLPPSGVIVDRLELPDHTNIKGVFVFYTRPGDDTLVTLNSGKPLPVDAAIQMPRNLPIARVVLEVVEKNIAQDAILMTLQIWGCFVPGTTTPALTTMSESTVPCEAESMLERSILSPESLETSDKTLDLRRLLPGNPAGPAVSFEANLRVAVNFNGGAALDKLVLPTHGNILTIKILIQLPGETKYIPYMGGQPIPVTDAPIPLPTGMMANQVVVVVLEKLQADLPITLTLNIWACFDVVTTPAYSSNSYTSPPECEVKVINFSRVDGLAGASSQMSGAKAVQALKGSNGFWSPTTDDVETYPYLFFQINAREGHAVVYKVTFTLRFSKFVVLSLFNRNDQNVDTSEKIKCNTPVHHKRITYNFYGQTGDKVYIYVSPTKNTQSQVSDLEIHACYTPEVATTIAPTPLTTTPEPITCYFSCDAGSTCVHAEELCDGKCNCYDCRDEENCTTTTPADVCGGFGYEPVVQGGQQVICGGAAGATCPRPSDRCTYFPGADFGPCCRANEETTTTTKFETTTPTQNGGWGTWSPWSRCTRSCGPGEETRYRLCNQPPPGPGGAMCAGDATGSRPCRLADCAYGLPNWSPWSAWGDCDVTCGTGKRARTRACDSPAPGPGDTGCQGNATQTLLCMERPCMCTFDMITFRNAFGYEPAEQIGYVESDGKYGPTSPDEDVYIGDKVDVGVIVHVDCSNCTCMNGLLQCIIGQCEECSYWPWGPWSLCSKSCDVGQKWRTRRLRVSGGPQAAKCKPELTEREDCSVEPCPTALPPSWNPWSPWSACTPGIPCLAGTQLRTRACNHLFGCLGDAMETRHCENTCNEIPSKCPPGLVWSTCANRCPHTCFDLRLNTCTEDDDMCVPGCTCADGMMLYNSMCVPVNNCPCYDTDGSVVLHTMEINRGPCETCVCRNGTFECNKDPECCTWDAWGTWGQCSDTCGRATRNRYRSLLHGSPVHCGQKFDTQICPYRPCPADCVYEGLSYNVGDVIPGSPPCLICRCTTGGRWCERDKNAIVHGSWGQWTSWSGCSRTCAGGLTNRFRMCNLPLQNCGGSPCAGENSQTLPCNNNVTCCEVSGWTAWSECSATCDSGTRERRRQYTNPLDWTRCHVTLLETGVCLERPCNMRCNVSAWSEWSACSVRCGTGRRERSRRVLGITTYDCPTLIDDAVCYAGACNCGTNEYYTNCTTCEDTCANRLTSGPYAVCNRTGCLCARGYYRNQKGQCVTGNQCEVCVVNGEEKKPGETWAPTDNKCVHCECVNGDVMCSPRCEIPVCKEDETLSYDVTDPCCPRCVKQSDTCQLQRRLDFLYDAGRTCRSVDKVEFTFCMGSCGNSTASPQLLLHTGYTLDVSCRCCTGDVDRYSVVNVLCGEGINKRPTTALVPVMSACRCRACAESRESVPADAFTATGKRK